MHAVLHGGFGAIHEFFVLVTDHVGGMGTFEEGFEDSFIRRDLFIFLIILGLMLLWLMVKYLFHLLVRCWKRQVV